MEIRYKLLALFGAVVWTLTSCQKDLLMETATDYVASDTQSIVFKQEGETKIISLSGTSGAWSIDQGTTPTWLQITKEDNNLKVTALKNDGAEERFSKITLKYSGGTKSFPISQFGSEPVLRLEEGASPDFIFDKNGKKGTIVNVVTNSDAWTVQRVGEEVWFSYEQDQADHKLTFDLAEFERDAPNATTNRSEVLFLSNGNKHLKLSITQNGWAQFPMPTFIENGTRTQINDAEVKKGRKRDIEMEENQVLIQGEKGDKVMMVFSSEGEQVKYILHKFEEVDHSRYGNKVILKADKKKEFVEKDLEFWMSSNKFLKGKPTQEELAEKISSYYRVDEDKTCFFKVVNNKDKWFGAEFYRGAYMEYTETSNDLKLSADGNMESFPVRDGAVHLHDVNFKLDEVIAYEAARGMVPDYAHELNELSGNPRYKYNTLIFKQAQEDTRLGKLVLVIYEFNRPGVTDVDGVTIRPEYSSEDRLLGTVAKRQDIYEGKDYAYKPYTSPYTGETSYSLNMRMKYQAGLKGYRLLRTQDGYTTFVRGVEDFVDIDTYSTRTKFIFYKSKVLMDAIKN